MHYLYPLKTGKEIGPIQATRYGSGRVEWEANWFAAGLLMPEEQFSSAYRSMSGDVIGLADQFGVSVSAATVRAQALGLGT